MIPEKRTNTHWLDPEKMKLLKQLADATGGAIVLTTYWRDYWQQTNTEAGRLIEESFAQAELQIYSKTGHANIREEEIADWMIENRVKAFVVLDDDPGQFFSDLWEKPESFGSLIITDKNTGLTEKDVARAIKSIKLQLLYEENK